ncbi:MAG: exodeoxyribonuclease VII large subunit, partial [Verrucomicrobiota bacterium]
MLERRHPGLELVLAPCRVQGYGAAAEIASALDRLNRYAAGGGRLDCVLVTRGGGSLEDLWAFNEEGVARAIVRSALPVITGVGHEIDFTIADFAADLRAATPSAAAEILTAGWVAAGEQVVMEVERLQSVGRLQAERHGVRLAERVLQLARQHPRRVLEARGQELDDRVERLVRAAARGGRDRRAEGSRLFQRMAAFRPRPFLDRLKERRELSARGVLAAARRGLADRRARLDRMVAALRMLSPEQVLERGFSITFDAATGTVVRKAGDIRPGQRLRTRLASGEVGSVATSVRDQAG